MTARNRPQGGARGMVPLHQETDEDAVPGTIENPIMSCPVCGAEYPATGATWMGTWSLKDMTDDEIEQFAEVLNPQMVEMAQSRSREAGMP